MAIHTLLDEHDRAFLLERGARLTPDLVPRWGRMNAAQMVRHCVEALRGSVGDVHHAPLGRHLFHTRLVRRLFIRAVPFPRNAPTAPELRVTEPAVLDAERERLIALVGRYGRPEADVGAEHPLFGVLTRDEWAELEYKHIDHHFRQFGV